MVGVVLTQPMQNVCIRVFYLWLTCIQIAHVHGDPKFFDFGYHVLPKVTAVCQLSMRKRRLDELSERLATFTKQSIVRQRGPPPSKFFSSPAFTFLMCSSDSALDPTCVKSRLHLSTVACEAGVLRTVRLVVEPVAVVVEEGEVVLVSTAALQWADLATAERSCTAPIGVDGTRELM
eukprot:SAG11_NODE_1239_length_5424_cov_8.855399_5_plen_177_part_00